MKAKKGLKWLKAAALVLVAVIMAVVCHAAYFPYNILPSGFKYAVYPVSGSSIVAPLEKGDMAVCVKGADLAAGWPVKYNYHPLSSFSPTDGPLFGRMLEYSGLQGTVFDVYRVQVSTGGEALTLNSARPELIIYRVRHIGSLVLLLNQYRQGVLAFCSGAIVLYAVLMAVTARPRRLRRSRELYLEMFERFAKQFENEAEDF